MNKLDSIHDLYYKCLQEFDNLDIDIEEDIIGIDNGILCIDFIIPKNKIWLTQDDRKNSLLYTYIDNDNLYYKPASNKNRLILIKPTYDAVFNFLLNQFKYHFFTLFPNNYDKYINNKIYNKNKLLFNSSKMRNFTKEESEAYHKHLLKLFKSTGRKRF